MTTRPIKQGMIVWATVPDPRGHAKRRPVVVVTPDDRIAAGGPVVAVAVTTTFPDPPPPNHLPLPWDPLGRSTTKLRRRSAAVCDWLLSFDPSDIQEIAGILPRSTLLELMRKILPPKSE